MYKHTSTVYTVCTLYPGPVKHYRAVHAVWGNLTPIATASTRGSPQTEISKKMKFRHMGHLELILKMASNVRRNFFFFFLRAGGLPRVLEGLGWWWSPRLWARPSKKTWRREAICLSVQALNISVLLYTVYLSFNAHSVTHSAIIWQYWVKIS